MAMRKSHEAVLNLETLEDRNLLANLSWDNTETSGAIEFKDNWLDGGVPAAATPGPADNLIFSVTNATNASLTFDKQVNSIEFQAGKVTLENFSLISIPKLSLAAAGTSLQIATAGAAHVTVRDIDVHSAGAIHIGVLAANVGTLELAPNKPNQFSQLAATGGPIIVGVNGIGKLFLSSTSETDADANTTGDLILGMINGSNGSIDAEGENSLVKAATIVVGQGGVGSLTLDTEGEARSNRLIVAQFANSSGSIAVSDGAELNIDNTVFGPVVGDVFMGLGGIGIIDITSGGQVASINSRIAAGAGSATSKATVSGSGSLWDSTGIFEVGSRAHGLLDVELGGIVRAMNFVVGSRGLGQVEVRSGGHIESLNGSIAEFVGSANSTATVSGLGSLWNNSGTLDIGTGAKGTLIVDAGGVVWASTLVKNNINGVIQGGRHGIGGADAYIITPNVLNLGTFIVGFSPDRMNVEGNFEQGVTGSLQIELGGTTSADEYDVLSIAAGELGDGHATLGGTLEVSLINSFDPQVGDYFSVLTCEVGGLSGEFDRYNLPELGEGLKWTVVLDNSDSGSDPWSNNGLAEVILLVEETTDPDIVITGFHQGTGTGEVIVEYRVDNAVTGNFTIGIYPSSNGVSINAGAAPLVATQTISTTSGDLGVIRSVTFMLSNLNKQDISLVAFVDAGEAITEASEYNNEEVLAGPSIEYLAIDEVAPYQGEEITLTATTVADEVADVTQVKFWRDLNGNGSLDTSDQLVGTATEDVDGDWSVSVSTLGFGLGSQTFFAQAFDDAGLRSAVVNSSIELQSPYELIIDNSDSGYAEFGSIAEEGESEGWRDGALDRGYEDNYRPHQTGSADDYATFTFSDLEPALYEIWTTWREYSNRASDVPFTVLDGATEEGTVRVNQQAAPSGLDLNGVMWTKLGEYMIDGSTLSVKVSGDAEAGPTGSDQGPGPYNEAKYFIADAVRIVRVDQRIDPNVANAGGAGVTQTGAGWTNGSLPGGFQGEYQVAAAGNGSSTTTFSFTGLEAGASYQILGTWVADANRATNSPFTVVDGATTLGTTLVNQQAAPTGVNLDAFNWANLGVFTSTSGSLDITLSNNANGYVVADAIRLVQVADVIVDDGGVGYSESGSGWTQGNPPPGSTPYSGDYRVHAAGTGANTATWTFTDLADGTYDVFTTWTAHSNRASNAKYSIADGGDSEGTFTVNQKNAPNDELLYGVSWEKLATVTVENGILTVTLSDNANGYVIADAVRIRLLD